jgi:hypothetical protein
MASNPAAAAEMARSMAEALAATGNCFTNYYFLFFLEFKIFFVNNFLGASADEIAATMQEALNASLGNIDEDHLEEMLDVADTVARYLS